MRAVGDSCRSTRYRVAVRAPSCPYIPRFLLAELATHIAAKVRASSCSRAQRAACSGRRVPGSPLTAAAERIGVPGLSPHKLRHTGLLVVAPTGFEPALPP